MHFKQYKKIHRLGSEENDWILVGQCYIQEKIDGANTCVWFDWEVKCASRTQLLTWGFNGFFEYIKNHEGIQKMVKDNPECRFYFEWLVRHTISYNETAYKQAYLLDIEYKDSGRYLPIENVYALAKKYNIKTPKLFDTLVNPTIEQINKFVGKTELGTIGEWVVIKNFDFINQFGDNEYAKIVTEKFKEDNGLIFGGNNKHGDSYWEMYIINKYITLERIQKIMNKMQPYFYRKLDMEHTSAIAGSAVHDMITEEAWAIFKKAVNVNYKLLNRLASKKAIQIYHDILNNNLSVANIWK